MADKPAPKADEEEFDLFGSDEEPAPKPQKPKKAEKKAKEQPQVPLRLVKELGFFDSPFFRLI